ncbi:MAG: glycosyltransferase family 1 protein, partial [Lachnospiraceae bacterium]|nr:glycosyltransferase family 1 protein [Lachnospiraceae bacterium]
MQRVLIVHNHYRIPGGEDVVAENEEKLLKSHGHELFRYERDNGEPVGRLCMFLSMFFSLRTYREIRQLIREKKIDIVHVHNTLFLISPSVF